MSAIMRFPDFKYLAVTLSYDDGSAHDKRLLEIIDKYGLKATMNICSGNIGKPGCLSKDEIQTLILDKGHELAIHGERHMSLGTIHGGMAVRDVVHDKENLEAMFGRIVSGMAYANGSTNDDIVEVLRTMGVHYARTTVSTEKFDIPKDWLRMPATTHHRNPKLMELAKNFVETPLRDYYWARNPRLFYMWGHSHEFARQNNWEILEEFGEYIGHRDNVWYATNGEIYDYVQAYNRLEFSCDGTLIYNPTVIPVYIYDYGKDIKIEPGQTVDTKTIK